MTSPFASECGSMSVAGTFASKNDHKPSGGNLHVNRGNGFESGALHRGDGTLSAEDRRPLRGHGSRLRIRSGADVESRGRLPDRLDDEGAAALWPLPDGRSGRD